MGRHRRAGEAIVGRLFPFFDRLFPMKTNVSFISSIRRPFRSLLFWILFGLISFGFITKAVQFILIQRETGVLGSYYRSIGILENIEDPIVGDISAGIDLIQISPYFAYGDQRETVSGVMSQMYNRNTSISNSAAFTRAYPEEQWPNVHMTEMWLIGELTQKEEIVTESGESVGYSIDFHIDTLFAAHPDYTAEGRTIEYKFIFEDQESAIPLIDKMVVGQRYFIRGWENIGGQIFDVWDNWYEIKPLDGKQLWYIPVADGESIDFSDAALASIKNKIDILNENLHTLEIITTADMSAMPQMQESAHVYYLIEGRWLNHQDNLEGNKVIVVPEELARLRGLQLGDELKFTFRPLTDTYYGRIRDGVDSENWRSYPTYQDTFTIVGIYARTSGNVGIAYIPTNSLRTGFTSAMQDQFKYEINYSFVLDSSDHESEFVDAYKEPLQEMGIRLTMLENNGEAFWASVGPIRRSLSSDLLVFGVLMVVVFILAVFLYLMQHKRDYAILRSLGVPTKQANIQLVLPLLLMGGIGIVAGGLPAWNYALDRARATLSTLPTPGGVSPSAELTIFALVSLCVAAFLLLALCSWIGAVSLAGKPVFELLQGNATQQAKNQKQAKTSDLSQPPPSISVSQVRILDNETSPQPILTVNRADLAVQRKYTPASLSRYVLHHMLRSRLKSFLTLVIALGFVLAAGWVRQTMESSRLEVDRLYDTTEVDADILQTNTATRDIFDIGDGFVYRKTINAVLDSGYVKRSILEADTVWFRMKRLNTSKEFATDSFFSVYAFDSPETFYAGLENPDSLSFAPGWDMDRFAKAWTWEEIQGEGIPAIFPAYLLEQFGITLGDQVQVSGLSYSYPCLIVGQYTGGLETTNTQVKAQSLNPEGAYILIPLSVLESLEGNSTKFTVAHFVLDPARNRELSQFQSDMEEVMDLYAGKVRLVIWDEELRIVIGQLGKNISLLEVLYPVVIVVSVLVGAGLCFLLLLQTTREAAILRVLGTTRAIVQLALIIEPQILSTIGVMIGLGIAYFLWITSSLVPAGSLLISAGLYLAGVLAGSVSGAISVSSKKPIELLQVKE
jgi:ABC-type antimicrobial peptide transport system permease subunit